MSQIFSWGKRVSTNTGLGRNRGCFCGCSSRVEKCCRSTRFSSFISACLTHSPVAVLILLDPSRALAAAIGRTSPSLHRAKNKKRTASADVPDTSFFRCRYLVLSIFIIAHYASNVNINIYYFETFLCISGAKIYNNVKLSNFLYP